MMSQFITRFFLFIGLVSLTTLSFAETVILDKIAAIVDEDLIMEKELQQRIGYVKKGAKEAKKKLPPPAILRSEVLQQMITESLLLQMGEKAGIRIPDSHINQIMGRVAKQNRMTLNQFRLTLESQGESYADAREQLRREVVSQEVQKSNVRRKVLITPSEIDHFISSEEGQKLTAPSYETEHLLLPLSSSASADEESAAKKRMANLKKSFHKKSADSLIKSKSTNAQGKLRGGSLGLRKEQELPSLFTKVVPTLKQGDVSEVIRSPSGFHLVKLITARGEGSTVTQTHARHILLSPTAIRSETESLKQAKELRRRALKGEDFAELAKEFSDDIGSAREGGDLGWANPGMFVPEFEEAMNKTKKGKVTQPVKTQFGWHIIQVLDRRDQDMSEQMQKNIAYDYLFKKKYDEQLSIWLQLIRSEAYVEIK